MDEPIVAVNGKAAWEQAQREIEEALREREAKKK